MYCTQDDIMASGIPEDDLIQLTDDEDLGVVDETVVAKAISRADEMIDGYLRNRYEVPVDPVPGVLNTIAIDLVVYFLYGHRPHIETPARVEKSYNDARSDLQKIQNGNLLLGIEDVESTGKAETSGSGRIFTTDTLQNF